MTERIVLHELDRVGAIHHLSDDEAAALAALALVEVRPAGDGRWRLLPNGRVGAARCGRIEVYVRPKVDIARLLFLLGYARDPGFRPEDVDGITESDLWPALAHTLARQAERALQRGVLQGYVTTEEALPLVRGRIRLADQLARRPGTLVPLEVRYDDYAADIAENSVLRAALRRMSAVPNVDPAVRSRLTHLDARLSGASVINYGAPVPAWRLSRINSRYAPALRIAELVLRHQSVEPGPGGLDVSAFVVDMADVFEDFVTAALREALAPYPGYTEAQHSSPLDEQGLLTIRPDVVHMIGGHAAAVFDAKYKLQSPTGRYANADTYQMLTYCTALGVRTGWLVYAQGANVPGVHRVRNTSVDVIHYPLDLGAKPADLLAQMSNLAELALKDLPVSRR